MKKGDKRRLRFPLTVRTATSISTIPAGEIIEIQQDPDKYRNVLVHSVWMHGATVERISIPLEGEPS